MSKRDGSSPNENLSPASALNMAQDCTSSTPAKKPRLDIPERIQVAGRVSSVKLQNFMCHGNLQIDFNTRENNCFYIGGPNGSGKSALFAAINLGLGGRGSDNDRGNTVKSYIKDGTTQAKITITLTNAGLNAHQDYDDLVSIERTINQSSSTYVMKSIKLSSSGNTSERVISKKKADIDRIIERFNIHLSNPAFWMSQDRSRSFLANFKPSNVYKLYLESTNLENIRSSYIRFDATIKECRRVVDQKTAEVALESRKLKRMQEQRELQAQLETDRAQMLSYRWKLMFCPLRDLDTDLAINLRKQELQKKYHEQFKVEYAKNRLERAEVEKKIQSLSDEVTLAKEDVDEADVDLEEKTKKLSSLQEAIKTYDIQIRRKKNNIKQVQEAIENTQRQMDAALDQQGNAQLTERIKNVDSDLHRISQEREEMELSGELNKLKDKIDQLYDDYRNKEGQKSEVSSHISKLRSKLRQSKDLLRTARATKQNTINKFGRNMAEIIEQITKHRQQFQKLPKGPLGKFVTLTQPKWSLAVEECIANLASCFLCSCNSDAALLRKIFESLRIPPHEMPQIIVTEFSGQIYQNLLEPKCDFQSFYRVLQISDPDIHNALIDKTNCEQFLLFEEKNVAMKVMGSNNPPSNVRKAYTLDGAQVYVNGPKSQYRFYPGKGQRATGIFCSDKIDVDEAALSNEAEEMEKEISRLESTELRKYESELRELYKERQNAKVACEDFERKLSNLRSQEVKMNRILEDLKRDLAQTANEDQIDTFADTIEELKKKIPEIEKEWKELENQIKEVEVQIKPAIAEKEKAKMNRAELQKEVENFKTESHERYVVLGKFDEEAEVMRARLDKLKADGNELVHEEARIRCDKDEKQVEINIEKQNHPMPPGEQDPPDLADFPPTEKADKLATEMQKRIDRAAQGCDMSITFDAVKKFKEVMKKHRYFCRSLSESLDKLQDIHDQRVKAYPTLRHYTQMKVCEKFRELLEVRGHFIGGLEFDHDKQTLNVNVKSCKEKDSMADRAHPEESSDEEVVDSEPYSGSDSDDGAPRRKKSKPQKKKKKQRDLKGLSGGERSFVTAALVMSLWEVMEQPFRMMDEFDVFMDMMNRKLVMDLLVELATKKFPHNQFIFFTPQGIKELKIVDGLQVFEMNKVRD